jgi:GntR family transcriptional regulator
MKSSSHPYYTQIIDSIVQCIEHGEYKPGQQLPTQRELCEEYHTSLITMRKALDELLRLGVLRSIPGKGIYVNTGKQATDYGSLVGFESQMARLGLSPMTRTLEAKLIAAPTVIARILGVEPGSMVVYVQRLRFADGKPFSLYKVYVPHSLCPGILDKGLADTSLFSLLRQEYNHKLVGSRNTVSAIMPDEEAIRLLELNGPVALLLREQITYIETGEIIEYSVNQTRGDIYCVRYDEGQIFQNY